MKHDHPAYYLECCTPWYRTKPSGRVEIVHRFNCPVAPNKVAERTPAPRAEIASHATRFDREGYEDYWSDRAFEQEGGR